MYAIYWYSTETEHRFQILYIYSIRFVTVQCTLYSTIPNLVDILDQLVLLEADLPAVAAAGGREQQDGKEPQHRHMRVHAVWG